MMIKMKLLILAKNLIKKIKNYLEIKTLQIEI